MIASVFNPIAADAREFCATCGRRWFSGMGIFLLARADGSFAWECRRCRSGVAEVAA